MDKGLNLWREKVLRVQSESIKKAEERLKEDTEKRNDDLMYKRRKKEEYMKISKTGQKRKQQKTFDAFTDKIVDKEKRVKQIYLLKTMICL